jgi:pimeloyl-ACP methyl ester carboxylesterase
MPNSITSAPDSTFIPEQRISWFENQAVLTHSPCASGTMPWRQWGEGEKVVLIHGGSGSWMHWIMNIEFLSRRYTVIAPDLPGLGDAADLPEPYTAEQVAEIVQSGIELLIPRDEPYHLVGFSWGSTVSSLIARQHDQRLKSLMIAGAPGLGNLGHRLRMKPLLKRWRGMTDDDLWQVNEENLARLMIHDRSRIDDLAIYVQIQNTNKSRFKSPQFALTDLVLKSMAIVKTPGKVVYGEFDAPAYPNIEERFEILRSAKPEIETEVIKQGGHWVQYDEADKFNEILSEWLGRYSENRGDI